MPFVQVRITEGASQQQKEELIEGVTDLLSRVLDKNPASTHVMIEEVPSESWGVRGKTVAELRASGAPGVSRK